MIESRSSSAHLNAPEDGVRSPINAPPDGVRSPNVETLDTSVRAPDVEDRERPEPRRKGPTGYPRKIRMTRAVAAVALQALHRPGGYASNGEIVADRITADTVRLAFPRPSGGHSFELVTIPDEFEFIAQQV